MDHDDTIQPTTDALSLTLTLLADDDALLPATDHCSVRETDDVSRALARDDSPEVVVLGGTASGATVADAMRRLQGSRTRTWLVCQGALPAPATGTVTTVAGRESPRRAVERAVYLALVERHRELARRQVRADGDGRPSAERTTDASVVGAARSTYADRLDEDDFVSLYERI